MQSLRDSRIPRFTRRAEPPSPAPAPATDWLLIALAIAGVAGAIAAIVFGFIQALEPWVTPKPMGKPRAAAAMIVLAEDVAR
ncbi:hypothetical protein LOC51_00665 [Rubrivivax sp. JA1024]|nr:hypothetical protein [Rubrivivax sp. JA1024]